MLLSCRHANVKNTFIIIPQQRHFACLGYTRMPSRNVLLSLSKRNWSRIRNCGKKNTKRKRRKGEKIGKEEWRGRHGKNEVGIKWHSVLVGNVEKKKSHFIATRYSCLSSHVHLHVKTISIITVSNPFTEGLVYYYFTLANARLFESYPYILSVRQV